MAVCDFGRFLLAGKGASAATRECYVRHVRTMLAEVCDATGTVDLGSLPAVWVRSYVTRLGGRYAPASLKLIATAVRSFLRYAWVSGWTAADLAVAVGPVITHRSGRLPKALAAGDLRRLLASPDRRTTTGLRDYALLMLLARLGLRAGEVAGLCLDDFDWSAATVTAKVKGGGRLRLPIPADVGPVVVAYLRRRPAGAAWFHHHGRPAVFTTREGPHDEPHESADRLEQPGPLRAGAGETACSGRPGCRRRRAGWVTGVYVGFERGSCPRRAGQRAGICGVVRRWRSSLDWGSRGCCASCGPRPG